MYTHITFKYFIFFLATVQVLRSQINIKNEYYHIVPSVITMDAPLEFAVDSYEEAIRLYNENLKRRYKALEVYKEARKDALDARRHPTVFTKWMVDWEREAAMDFVAIALITDKSFETIDCAQLIIENIRNMGEHNMKKHQNQHKNQTKPNKS